nr:MAG TPA: hypothetical protein [Caudoviricetes sp.]
MFVLQFADFQRLLRRERLLYLIFNLLATVINYPHTRGLRG